MLTRRHFIITSAALFSQPIAAQAQSASAAAGGNQWARWDAQVTPPNFDPSTSNPWGLDPRFLPTRVQANDGLVTGDIYVDAIARYLYHIQPDGTAMRYGVGIARGRLYEPGIYSIRRKARWPNWRPTDDMIERDPGAYAQFADGMPGGPTNPLGSRALYLYVGGRDTYLRIHGTPFPRSIGGRATSGCVRMVMAHINGLYDQVSVGATARLYPAEESLTART
jgi:lipoprotein-anchoring transpeptidase ErfK/SrfK